MARFDKKIMTVKLSEVIAAVEKNLKSKTDFIKTIDLSNQIIYGDIVIISNEGQYFKHRTF
ncbi:MAG: hypothetical protein MJ193_00810 [Clostridia bacterium]|nr:hypothetical protein [Clostridia bacterium]